jgi:4-aminobutyrate aminotransferase-like enzyme/Ser/Thr protein kinase RdoA (MazF antagonist)/murein DD-endopeptidase MepM/ murein hydrolase activator NlpD
VVVIKQQAPVFSLVQGEQVAATAFGVRGTIEALPGEHDQNFLLTSADGERYVLKLSHVAEQRQILDLQNAALAHLADRAPDLALPRVVPSLDGDAIATVAGPDGVSHFARLFTYVPGRLLADTRPHTPMLLRSLGRLLGMLDAALADFMHPEAERELKWDLPRAGWIREYVHHIPSAEQRALVERYLALFEAEALPVLPGLRTSVVYNDANDYNVLVGCNDRSEWDERRAVGVIDFGDMTRTSTVCELAIGAAYAMLGKADPLAAAAHVTAGYHEVFPLTEEELTVLYPLILARLCISVTNSAYQRVVDPANAYLQVSEAPAWELLKRLADVPPAYAYFTLRAACGLPACPKTPWLVAWLQSQTGTFGRVVEPKLNGPGAVVLDLSIGSRDLGTGADIADTDTFTRMLFETMREAGAVVGIGRYDEPRPIYTSDAYRVEGNDGPEWRTLHTAVDLFMEAGAPIYTPLAGVVHSFQNNAAPRDYGPTIVLEHTVENGGGDGGDGGDGGGPLTFYTLYGHLSLDSLDGLYEGKPVAKGKRIARVGDETVNGQWPPHLHFQIIADMLGKRGDYPGVALPSQRETRLSLSPDPNLILGIEQTGTGIPLRPGGLSAEAILDVRARHIGRNLSVSYRRPLVIVRGYLRHLYDETGRKYLDAVNNVPHVGHSHPRVVRAGQRQMAVLNTNTRYLYADLVRYAERLCATLPEPLSVCYFVCSGSEANELALRLARAHTGRRGVAVVDVAYHGNTTTLVDISPYKHDGPGGNGPAPIIEKVPLPDTYRGLYRADDPEAGAKYAAHVTEAAERARARGDGEAIGAFICESLPGCGGQIVPPQGYLAAAYVHARAAGAVCIADEVQTGFGRVGTHFWAFETQGTEVVPDIVTMGKPIGNGHPLGAVITTPQIAASFDNGMEYFNTFGGNPVSCAIGMAVLDVLEDEGLQANALRTGERLLAGLRDLQETYRVIGDVRGLGLYVGVELVRDRERREPAPAQASYVANRMRELGVLLSTDGPDHNVLKIKPPLVFNADDADFLVATLARVLAEDDAQV